jgi:hypothetical protein
MFRCKEFVVELFSLFKDDISDSFVSSLLDMFLWMVDDQEKQGGKIAIWAGVLETFIAMQLKYINATYRRKDSRGATTKDDSMSSPSGKGASSNVGLGFQQNGRRRASSRTSVIISSPPSTVPTTTSGRKTSSDKRKLMSTSFTGKRFSDKQLALIDDYLPIFSESTLAYKENKELTVLEYTKTAQDVSVSLACVTFLKACLYTVYFAGNF